MDDISKLNQRASKRHNITMNNREDISMTGIVDVLSFDEELVICQSDIGILVLKGMNLHVNKLDLDNGILELTGFVIGLQYEEDHILSKNRPSIFSKIFK